MKIRCGLEIVLMLIFGNLINEWQGRWHVFWMLIGSFIILMWFLYRKPPRGPKET